MRINKPPKTAIGKFNVGERIIVTGARWNSMFDMSGSHGVVVRLKGFGMVVVKLDGGKELTYEERFLKHAPDNSAVSDVCDLSPERQVRNEAD